MILTNVLHPHLDVATDFPMVHHRGRSRAGCSHMTYDLPLGSQWGSSLCLGSCCPLMWWLQAVGFAWTHPPWHPSPLDPLHYSYSPRWGGERNRIWKKKAARFKTFSDHKQLLLNLPWSGEHKDRVVFLRNWIWKQDCGSMGIPPRLGGDHIHWKVIGESIWFPWFTLPLWELIHPIASDTVLRSSFPYINMEPVEQYPTQIVHMLTWKFKYQRHYMTSSMRVRDLFLFDLLYTGTGQ